MNMGTNAEYVCISESGTVALKPSNLSYEEAATLPYGAIMATSLLAKGSVRRGQKVLINGASGGIGSMAVQLAKHFGAEVTGVCGTPRLEFVKSLGVDKVIDYTKEDFTQNGVYGYNELLGRADSGFEHIRRIFSSLYMPFSRSLLEIAAPIRFSEHVLLANPVIALVRSLFRVVSTTIAHSRLCALRIPSNPYFSSQLGGMISSLHSRSVST
jgi:hypothetical protein